MGFIGAGADAGEGTVSVGFIGAGASMARQI